MPDRPSYLELSCSACSWGELCGVEGIVRWLMLAGLLKPNSEADPDLLAELFRGASPRFGCPRCGAVGLTVTDAPDRDDWPGGRPCDVCGKSIPDERLAALPDARLCSTCQAADERGQPLDAVDYCPRCGAPLELRPSRRSGITRYVSACTGSPPCRL